MIPHDRRFVNAYILFLRPTSAFLCKLFSSNANIYTLYAIICAYLLLLFRQSEKSGNMPKRAIFAATGKERLICTRSAIPGARFSDFFRFQRATLLVLLRFPGLFRKCRVFAFSRRRLPSGIAVQAYI